MLAHFKLQRATAALRGFLVTARIFFLFNRTNKGSKRCAWQVALAYWLCWALWATLARTNHRPSATMIEDQSKRTNNKYIYLKNSWNQDQQRAVRNSRRSEHVHTLRVRNPRVVHATRHTSQQSSVAAAAVAGDSDNSDVVAVAGDASYVLFVHCLSAVTFIPVIPTHVHLSLNSPAKAHSTPSFSTPAFSTPAIWCHVFYFRVSSAPEYFTMSI